MTYKGKILIAKQRTTLQGVHTTKDPSDRTRFTGMSTEVHAGGMVLCIQEHNITPNPRSFPHNKLPRVYVLHGEMTFEAEPSDFEVAEPSEKLKGKSVCFTGALKHTREYYKALVELHGGTAAPGVTRSLSYLVMADPKSNSTKAEKARSYGTPTINESTLMGLIR